MSADQENKDADVTIHEATPRGGRRKGRKHDAFTLPSGEKVQIYYVNPETLPTGYYYAGMPKAFYAQVAGQEFRSDTPTKIQPAVIEYLKETKPAVFEEVIITGNPVNVPCSETIRVLHIDFIRTKYGVRGDGTPMLKGKNDVDTIFHPSPHTRIVPFTEKRWTRIKGIQKIVDNFTSMLQLLATCPATRIVEMLDGEPLFAGEEELEVKKKETP